jgi:UDP-N-acetylglucosamine 2-epimerase (non-hydrolysing)
VTRKAVLVAIGTRPEAIKLSPVINKLNLSKQLRPVVVSTGQHGSLLDTALEDLGLIPDFSLSIMRENQSLSESAARVLSLIAPIIISEEPIATLVQGDTTTSLMGALGSFYNRIPVGHVEAGLRTSTIDLPFPEEANRRLISVLATFHFTPTLNATEILLKEGYETSRIIQTGNTGVDALLDIKQKLENKTLRLPKDIESLQNLPNLVLVTCHRRETFGKPLEEICEAITFLSDQRPDLNIIFPVHPNPNVRKTVEEKLKLNPKVRLLHPLPYSHFVALLSKARVIITDSGGVQEEAPSLGKRTIVLRDITERSEAIDNGMATMVGANKRLIINAVLKELEQTDNNQIAQSKVFGYGNASELIVQTLEKYFS